MGWLPTQFSHIVFALSLLPVVYNWMPLSSPSPYSPDCEPLGSNRMLYIVFVESKQSFILLFIFPRRAPLKDFFLARQGYFSPCDELLLFFFLGETARQETWPCEFDSIPSILS